MTIPTSELPHSIVFMPHPIDSTIAPGALHCCISTFDFNLGMDQSRWCCSPVLDDWHAAMRAGSGCYQVKAYGLSHVSDMWGPTTAGLRRYSVCARQLHHCCATVLCPLVTETLANCVSCSMRCNGCCFGMTAVVLSVFSHAPFGGSSRTLVFVLFHTLGPFFHQP
jgi:hypothetical protein